MPEKHDRIHWEKLSKNWWSSAVGCAREERGIWTGFVYKNTRTGEAYTETETGFPTALAAIRWVENRSES
ncbi:MAG TPA: hypothetical protein VHW24_21230 [Bryobacteraceae bacterium]|jgi:hypothetical protein|nr:hypothetical protein [Bryobacteraceae bacterium]